MISVTTEEDAVEEYRQRAAVWQPEQAAPTIEGEGRTPRKRRAILAAATTSMLAPRYPCCRNTSVAAARIARRLRGVRPSISTCSIPKSY